MFYFAISLIIFIKIVWGKENLTVITISLIAVAAAMLLALVQYAVVFFRMNSKKNKETAEK